MRLQLRILGTAFVIFGVFAWIIQSFSPVYVGLIGFGVVAFVLSVLAGR